jgi:hypothetical protein
LGILRLHLQGTTPLIAAADKHNIDRDSAVQYYSDLFSAMASVATFEHYEMDGGADGKG